MQERKDALSRRKEDILRAVVEAYIAAGEPVGSKGLAESLGVSSATIRNEMADLSTRGLLEQPHTSAGRTPTDTGYRYYIDNLMEHPAIPEPEQRYLDSLLLLDAYEPDRLLANVAQMLADLTRFAALSTPPPFAESVIRGIQFVQTSRRTAMAVMMTSGGSVKNRMFRCDFDLTPDIMRIFFRVLNSRLAGQPVTVLTPGFIQTLGISLGELTPLISSALVALLEIVQDSMQTEIRLNGQTNLLFYPEFSYGNARAVMDFLESREKLNGLLFRTYPEHTSGGRAHVLIGQETQRPELARSSLLAVRYAVAGKEAGIIGILGPTRMDYSYWIARLEYLAQSVGRMLTELLRED